jgi:hypothetical protein
MSERVIGSTAALSESAPSTSAVAWGAIIAGAVAATAFSLALLILGAGIGLVSVSPWSVSNPSVATFGTLAAAWFIAVQLFACGLGGYLAGRLREPWADAHVDEAHFRDTAHGLLVWALGGVITALLVAVAASSIAGGVAHAGAAAADKVGGAVVQQATAKDNVTGYFTDMLFRSDHPAATDAAASRAEIGRIFLGAAASGELPATDKTYVAQVVAAQTGLNQADAEKRVSDVFDQAKSTAARAAEAAKKTADAARKTGIYVSLWGFIALLVGAFSASYMAVVGGRQREELYSDV